MLCAAVSSVVALTACSSPAPGPSSTATAAAASAPSAAGSSAATPSGPSTSAPAAASAAAPAATATATTASDPNRPAKQCPDPDLKVRLQKYGLAAGHTIWQLLFTNTGSRSCDLRGFPGVSMVGHRDGTQLGEPASRGAGTVTTVHVAPGSSNVNAILSVTDVGEHGGPLGAKCPTAAADGFRVYPPHSRKAVFVPATGLRACTGGAVYMTIDPVGDNPK